MGAKRAGRAGSGPPFTLTIVVHCPGMRENKMCGGSARAIDVLDAGLRPGATDDDERRADSRRGFCMGFNCPLSRRGRHVQISRLESILATLDAESQGEEGHIQRTAPDEGSAETADL